MNSTPGPAVLFVSYDGALDPLGHSQVVPYVEGLARFGYRFYLLTFEKRWRWHDEPARAAMAERLERSGITWHPLPYHKRPPVAATARDIAVGLGAAGRIHADDPLALVHARSYPSALIAQRLGRATGVPFLFDMRGFYPEERVEGGLWNAHGPLFQVAKRLERDFLREAAGVVTLTEASVPILHEAMDAAGSHAPLVVIPTATDLDRFRLRPPPEGPFRLTYVGSIGTWYLLDEMMALGAALLRSVPDSRLEFVVNGEEGAVHASADRMGIPAERLEVGGVPHDRVPEALARASATFFLIRPGGSKIASAATKFGESLAVGRPVVSNAAVGDTAKVITEDRVGVVVEPGARETYEQAARAVVQLARSPGTAERCRATAERRYALSAAVARYAEMYGEILGDAATRPNTIHPAGPAPSMPGAGR